MPLNQVSFFGPVVGRQCIDRLGGRSVYWSVRRLVGRRKIPSCRHTIRSVWRFKRGTTKYCCSRFPLHSGGGGRWRGRAGGGGQGTPLTFGRLGTRPEHYDGTLTDGWTDEMADRQTDRLIRLANWLTGQPTDRSIDRPTDELIDCFFLTVAFRQKSISLRLSDPKRPD